jgi:putative membrane protein
MKLYNFRNCVLVAFTPALIACNNSGRDSYTGDTTVTAVDRSMASFAEEDFVADVIETSTEEIAWLREAEQKGTDAKLKSQAQLMIPDFEKINKDMKAHADRRNFKLDNNIDTTVRLAERKGLEWDEEWADELGDKNRRLIRRYERAENRILNPDVKKMISETLPVLRSHLDSLDRLETRLDEQAVEVIK